MRNNKGQFIKGNAGKPKGATSTKTNKIREAYQLLIENSIETLAEDLRSLEPKERLEMIINLSNFVIPKLKSTDMTLRDEPIIIDFSE